MPNQEKEPPVRSILKAREDEMRGILITEAEKIRLRVLFGDMMMYYDINDFSFDSWTFFLDNTRTLGDLLDGLYLLSPFVDDALEVAETMTEQDFWTFKICLANERRANKNGTESNLPQRYDALVIPTCFSEASHLAYKFDVDLGVALMRLYENRKKARGKNKETL